MALFMRALLALLFALVNAQGPSDDEAGSNLAGIIITVCIVFFCFVLSIFLCVFGTRARIRQAQQYNQARQQGRASGGLLGFRRWEWQQFQQHGMAGIGMTVQQPDLYPNPGAGAGGMSTMQIILPNGVVPGNQLQVATPDGQIISVTVPEGLLGGMQMTLQFMPRSGSAHQSHVLTFNRPTATTRIGITLEGQDPAMISSIAPGGLAASAGLKVGQTIMGINGTPVKNWHFSRVLALLKKQTGTVQVEVSQPNGSAQQYNNNV